MAGWAVCFLSLPAVSLATTYKVDPNHTSVTFRVRHLFTQVQGRFDRFEGKITFDPAQPQQVKVEGTVDVASVNTNVEKRDEDLRSKRSEAQQQSEAEAHTSACPRCARLRRTQESVKVLLRQRAPRSVTPVAVRQQVIAALDRAAAPAAGRRNVLRGSRLVVVGAIAALVVLAVIPLLRPAAPDLLAILAQDVRAVNAQELPLGIRTRDVEELRQYYRGTGLIDFERTAEDFGRTGFRPVGGTVGKIGAVKTTLTVYEGTPGRIVCRRFRAGTIQLPDGGERIGGAEFFSVDGTTVRISRHGDVICCLATAMPRAAFVSSLFGEPHP